MTYEIALYTVLAAVVAGISWNTLGVWQKWRNSEDSEIDWDRVKKNVIIGAILGIIAYSVQISGGIEASIALTIEGFIIAVVGFFPLIVVADKIFNRKKTEED